MGLGTTVFHPDFQKHHQATVNSTHNARVRVVRVLERGDWTPETGAAGDVLETLYEGPALVMKVANPTRADFVQDTVQSQAVRVELDGHTADESLPADFQWHDNDRVTVLNSPDDQMMQGVLLYVHGWLGNSHSWARNLFCRTSAKQL